MKKLFVSLLALAALAFSSASMAGSPASVKDATSTKAFGTAPMLRIHKDTSSGNRVQVLHVGGAVKYVDDNASWSVYAKLLTGLDKPVAAPASNNGLVYDAAKGIFECAGGNSYVTWVTNSNSDTVADSCALYQAVMQAAQ